MPDSLSVAIVGMGSRGASILERVVYFATISATDCPGNTVTVELIDPAALGEGLHTTSQPDYLLLNSPCGRISMFPDAASVTEGAQQGPSLFDWVTARGLRIATNGYSVGRLGRAIEPTDYLPRRILGEYLRWFVEHTMASAPETLKINVRCRAADDLEVRSSGDLLITLSDGETLCVDYAFLTLGQLPSKPGVGEASGNTISALYPIPDSLAGVMSGSDVAVEGFGLSAFDAIAGLTVGRGGRFIDAGNHRAYVPSGEEPRLFLYSRTGMPFRAQPTKPAAPQPYQPVVLTHAALEEIRRSHDGQISFDDSVLPLLMQEMHIAYYLCCAANDPTGDDGSRLRRSLLEAVNSGELRHLLVTLEKRYGAFDPRQLWDASPGMATTSSQDYRQWIEEFLRDDLAEAQSGLANSPAKAALEVTGDLRGTFRTLVKRRYLTDDSLELFVRDVAPLFNRAVVGPQMERQAELLALIDAGIVTTPFGPGPTVSWNGRTRKWAIRSTRLADPFSTEVDWLCRARVDYPGLESSASRIVAALAERRMLRRRMSGSRHIPGVDVDQGLHPVGSDGIADKRIWVIGPICEGSTFYNHTIPTLGGSSALTEAHDSVAELFHAHGGSS